jgi:polyisoprenoid-binding protein YceI
MRALRYLALPVCSAPRVSAQAAPVTYKLDPGHTMVLFSWNHFGFSNPTADLAGRWHAGVRRARIRPSRRSR